jgi:hypothetical protein
MPIQLGRDKNGCFARWGFQGAKYSYICGDEKSRDEAKNKAHIQGIAIGDFESLKISFDFDGVLTIAKYRDLLTSLLEKGNEIYVISARDNKDSMFEITDKLGVGRSMVFATGSNKEKINKINELKINTHYDNNPDVIQELGTKGILI